ncbi:MAG: Gfo/Idh/MocA family oxidoreductase [Planctomycetaceae bacterium]|nr:Gfo/Idh/MocA family oxidoreductase [Planctomycetaceae bacterium]
MSNSEYRAAIIGLGFIGGGDQVAGDRIGQNVQNLDGTHLGTLTKSPRIRLVAGCDLDPGCRERFGQRTSARNYSDWEKMLDKEQLDIVSIATPATTHAELTIACAERNIKVVYCEKPIATTAEEAERMIAACEKSGTLLVINHNRRFNPKYRHLRALIAAGDLGDLTSVYLRWASGRIGCVGTHLIDAARMLTGREITAVAGMIDESEKPDCRGPEFYDPGGWGMFQMEGGLKGLINAGNRAMGPAQIVVEGTLGRADTGGNAVNLEWFDGRLQVWPAGERLVTSMDRALGEIVAWLDKPGPFSTPAVGALRTFEVVAGMHLSHAEGGRWIELPLTGAARQARVKCA